MASKKKPIYNKEIKAYFENLKREKSVTSKQIAERLDVSAQTVTSLSGKLDSAKGYELHLMAESLGVDPGTFFTDIMHLSKLN